MPIIRKHLTAADVPVNPCDCEAQTKYRQNSDGTISISNDGGATYHDPPEFGNPLDPVISFPPVTGGDEADIRCKAANSVTGYFHGLQKQYHDALQAEVTALALAAIFQGALLLLGVGVFTIWGAIGTTIALLVAQKNADDFDAEFTSGFWEVVCKHAYCDCDAAGIYINTDPRQISDEVKADSPGYAADWLEKCLTPLSGVALTNAGSAGYNEGIDCSTFNCGGCPDINVTIGVLIEQGKVGELCYARVKSVNRVSHYGIEIAFNAAGTHPSTDCVAYDHYTLVSGSITSVALYKQACGSDPTYTALSHGECMSYLDWEDYSGGAGSETVVDIFWMPTC